MSGADVATRRKSWNQPLCVPCWCAFSLDQKRFIAVPITVPSRLAELHRCCVCGDETRDGIFVRLDPDRVVFPAGSDDEPCGREERESGVGLGYSAETGEA